MNIDENLLIQRAFEAQKMSYSPYSNFCVGSALLGKNGEIYQGCNIESASYSPTNCAERTAFFKAVSEGVCEFTAIAIVGRCLDGEPQFCAPCGVCRQVMAEFCTADFKIIIAKSIDEYVVKTLSELLPMAFGGEKLKK